jgi:hypothetical protein
MRPIRLIAAAAAIFCFSGCALPFGILSPQRAPAASASIQVDDPADQAEEDTTQPSKDESSAPTSGDFDVSSITARGGTSKECAAAMKVVTAMAEIGIEAAAGDVTQAMIDKDLPQDVTADIPVDAAPALAKLKATAEALIGLDFTTSTEQMNAFEDAYSDFIDVGTKICS